MQTTQSTPYKTAAPNEAAMLEIFRAEHKLAQILKSKTDSHQAYINLLNALSTAIAKETYHPLFSMLMDITGLEINYKKAD